MLTCNDLDIFEGTQKKIDSSSSPYFNGHNLGCFSPGFGPPGMDLDGGFGADSRIRFPAASTAVFELPLDPPKSGFLEVTCGVRAISC